MLVLWSSVAWNHYRSENDAIENSRRHTADMALLFASHAAATFKGVDYALREVRDTWTNHPAELEEVIKRSNNFLGKQILQTGIIDAKGFLRYSTIKTSKLGSYIGDREHFKVHEDALEDTLFVSRPVIGQLSKKWTIQFTRPIFDKGTYAGVIAMSVDPDYFVNFYDEAHLGKEGLASMMRDSGEIMVRSADLEKYIGKVIEPLPPYTNPGAPLQGSFTRASRFDHIERIHSYVRLPEYGLTLVIGAGVAEALAPVHRQQRQILLVASVVTLLTLLVALQLLRILKHTESVKQVLADSRASLLASHELLEDLTRHVPGIIFQYKLLPDGRSICPYVSDGVQASHGVTASQVRESASSAFLNVHPGDHGALNASIVLSARTLQPWQHEYRVNLPQQAMRWMGGNAQPKKLDDGSVLWHGFIKDITHIKATEAALQAANQELEAFSYSVSHDLRSPLNAITGFGQLLARKLTGSGDEKAQQHLSRILAGALQMERLIADLLALAHVARTQMKHEPINLSALASSVAEDLQARHPERQVALQIETNLQAQGDVGLLRAVLENLLGNAWKYSAKQLEAKIGFGQQLDAAANPVFFVRDNGAGFDMARADKLFQPFERLHSADEFAGTGIGLATVRRIILRHGGRVWAESAPSQGATFFFTLPPAAVTQSLQA